MLYILHMTGKSSLDVFMRELDRAQQKTNPNVCHYFVHARDQEEEVVVEGDMIYTKGVENLQSGAVIKTVKAFRYILDTHADADYVIRACMTQYFNVENTINEMKDLPQHIPTLYGIHEGGMVYGSYMVWNRKALEMLTASAIEMAPRWNVNEDLIFTNISKELGFNFIPRKKASKNVYDSTAIINGLKAQDVGDDWIFVKQKCNQVHIRDIVERHVFLRFVEKYDPEAYQILDAKYKKFGSELAYAAYEVLEYLYTIRRFDAFHYNMEIAISKLHMYTSVEYKRLISMILTVYDSSNAQAVEFLRKIANVYENPRSSEAELFYYNWNPRWRNAQIHKMFF